MIFWISRARAGRYFMQDTRAFAKLARGARGDVRNAAQASAKMLLQLYLVNVNRTTGEESRSNETMCRLYIY